MLLVVNINYGENEALMQACKPLADYARFVKYVRMNQADGLALPSAVDAAVDRAIREDLLDGFFRGHKAEVVGMVLAEYNEEQTQKNWFEDGRIEGRAEGRAEGIDLILANLVKDGIISAQEAEKRKSSILLFREQSE